VGLPGHELEDGVRDRVGDGPAEARRQDRVELGGEDQRRHGDRGEAVGRVVRETGVDLRPERFGRLLLRERQRLLDEPLYGAVGVCARRVDQVKNAS
jgi:hypothetical protein